MNSKSLTCVVFLLYSNLFLTTSPSSLIHFNSTSSILNVTLPHSLSQSLQNFALKTLTNQHHDTGSLYPVTLPENLSGIEISIVRLTGKSLWHSGANFSNVVIPARSVSVPPARRVAIVYQNLGNWSNHWYTVPGYRLITSVLGFKVFDVSDQDNVKEISLRMNNPVEISFRDLQNDLNEKMLSRVKCVSYKSHTEATRISRMVLPGVCYGSSHGDYSVIEPLEKDMKKVESWRTWWWLWIVGFVLGFCVLGFLGFVSIMGITVSRTKIFEVMMEREANDGEVLESRWVGGSKMPCATVTRTLPEAESEFENGSI